MKQKGVTMDVANQAKITYDQIKECVLTITTKLESVERFQVRWEPCSARYKQTLTNSIKTSI